MLDRGTILLLVSLNAIAVSVLYQRFSDTASVIQIQGHLQALYTQWFAPASTTSCGLIDWDSYVIESRQVVLPDGIQPAAVHVKGGKIVKITHDVGGTGGNVLSFGDAGVVSPGVIDVHVHLNEPGRVNWEGIGTGTRAAAAGGITTVVDMPLNSDPVTTEAGQLLKKLQLAEEKAWVNVGFWAGLVPENAHNHTALRELLDVGAIGFKSFMCPSGIKDFNHVSENDIAVALPFLKQHGAPFYVHAELVSDDLEQLQGDPTNYETYLASRPPAFEEDAIRMLVDVLNDDASRSAPGFILHIAHLSDSASIPLIQAAKQRHPITVETCPHYLVFSKEDIQPGQTHFKCAPPIRDAANRAQLLQAVSNMSIDLVSSDHSPAPPEMKQLETGDFMKAWGGISGGGGHSFGLHIRLDGCVHAHYSFVVTLFGRTPAPNLPAMVHPLLMSDCAMNMAGLQYLLPASWTALQPLGTNLSQLAALLSAAPAQLAGLHHRKGSLAVGMDADIMVWEPESAADTSASANQHKHKLSPYKDMVLKGKVLATIVGGKVVFKHGQLSQGPCGAVVTRHPHM